MSTRKPTPDIMGSLMNGSSNIAVQQESHNAISTAEPKAIRKASNKAIKPVKNKNDKQESQLEITEYLKEKATFNLPLSTLERLEDSWVQLRRKLKGKQRITKTQLVEIAIEMALDGLDDKKENSELYRRLN